MKNATENLLFKIGLLNSDLYVMIETTTSRTGERDRLQDYEHVLHTIGE